MGGNDAGVPLLPGDQDPLDSVPGITGGMVLFKRPLHEGDKRQEILLRECGETELLPVVAAAALPDLRQGPFKVRPIFRRERLPFCSGCAAYLLQRMLDSLVPVEEEPPPPQVVLRGVGHTLF